MSEICQPYTVKQAAPTGAPRAILDTDLYTLRTELEEIERRLIPLLVTVQRALGKEPSVKTRAERRRG